MRTSVSVVVSKTNVTQACLLCCWLPGHCSLKLRFIIFFNSGYAIDAYFTRNQRHFLLVLMQETESYAIHKESPRSWLKQLLKTRESIHSLYSVVINNKCTPASLQIQKTLEVFIQKKPTNNVYALIWCDILNGYFVDNIIIKDVATPDLKGHGHDFFSPFFFTF